MVRSVSHHHPFLPNSTRAQAAVRCSCRGLKSILRARSWTRLPSVVATEPNLDLVRTSPAPYQGLPQQDDDRCEVRACAHGDAVPFLLCCSHLPLRASFPLGGEEGEGRGCADSASRWPVGHGLAYRNGSQAPHGGTHLRHQPKAGVSSSSCGLVLGQFRPETATTAVQRPEGDRGRRGCIPYIRTKYGSTVLICVEIRSVRVLTPTYSTYSMYLVRTYFRKVPRVLYEYGTGRRSTGTAGIGIQSSARLPIPHGAYRCCGGGSGGGSASDSSRAPYVRKYLSPYFSRARRPFRRDRSASALEVLVQKERGRGKFRR